MDAGWGVDVGQGEALEGGRIRRISYGAMSTVEQRKSFSGEWV